MNNKRNDFLKKIKIAYLKAKNKINSSKFVLESYTLDDLIEKETIHIYKPKYKKEFENLLLTKENITIILGSIIDNGDEIKFLNTVTRTIKKLEKHNRKYNIKIIINDRELLNKSAIFDNLKNINLIIDIDMEEYTKEEFLDTEEKINNLINPIKEANLSPYEKYLAVYNIVKNFKPYKENEDNLNDSRNIKSILNNEYIVCVGYAKLLKLLLDRVGIPSITTDALVDTSFDLGFTQECIPTSLFGHERNIIKIDDDKYNIHGIYSSDPTWDNSKNYDLYINSAITYDKRKEAYRLEGLLPEDLLLDFHNFKEFNEKINFYLKREIKHSKKEEYKERIIAEYHLLYSKIITLLEDLDYNKYQELTKKYSEKLNKIRYNHHNINLLEIENIYSEFLTEYASYILSLSNKEINLNKTKEAIINIKRKIEKIPESKIPEAIEEIISTNEYMDIKRFPYIYNPNDKRINYLDIKIKKRTKKTI